MDEMAYNWCIKLFNYLFGLAFRRKTSGIHTNIVFTALLILSSTKICICSDDKVIRVDPLGILYIRHHFLHGFISDHFFCWGKQEIVLELYNPCLSKGKNRMVFRWFSLWVVTRDGIFMDMGILIIKTRVTMICKNHYLNIKQFNPPINLNFPN